MIQTINHETTEGITSIYQLEAKYLNILTADREISYDMPMVSGKIIKQPNDECQVFHEIDERTGDKVTLSDKTELLTFTPKKLLKVFF